MIHKNRIFKYISCLAIGVCTTYFFIVSYHRINNIKIVPPNVPNNSVWIGGLEGGVWVNFIKRRGDTLDFKIYSEVTGELEYYGGFYLEKPDSILIRTTEWSNYLNYFDGNNLGCFNEKSKDYNILKKVENK